MGVISLIWRLDSYQESLHLCLWSFECTWRASLICGISTLHLSTLHLSTLHLRDVPRWYVCDVGYAISTLHLCHVKSLFIYVTCLVHTCGLACSYVWHIRHLFIRAIHNFLRLCDVVSWHVWRALFIYATSLVHTSAITCASLVHMGHDLFMHVT